MLRRRLAKGSFAVAAALALVALPQAQAFATEYGPYYLVDRHSSKCIDDPRYSSNHVTQDIYTCVYSDNELWRNDSAPGGGKWWIKNVASGQCLTVLNGSTAQNVAVIQYECNTNPNEEWYYDYQGYDVYVDSPNPPPESQLARAYKIRNVKSGRCLTVENTGTANNSTLLQYDCNTNGSNIWLQGVMP